MSKQMLIIAGSLSFLAAFVHLACIVGGENWYRFLGAGEHMAQMAKAGEVLPSVITLVIASILIIWGLYAFSGAGVIRRLPLLRTALVLITVIYLSRAIAGLVLPFLITHPEIAARGSNFWLWSSLICLLFGITYLVGTYSAWQQLPPKKIN